MKKEILLLILLVCASCRNNAKKIDSTHTPIPDKEENLALVPNAIRNSPLFSTHVVEPTQLLDNIYYIGYEGVGSFVINTNEGIMLIDAMWNSNDAETVIESGIIRLGMDPKNIKKLIVTHEHSDHYGGARYFEAKYNTEILMSKVAWQQLHNASTTVLIDPFGNKSSELPIPKTYTEVKNEDIVLLGTTKIKILLTPGHTKGGISLLIEAYDFGKPYIIALWGGTGLPETLEANKNYLQSLNYFESFVIKDNASGRISNHPFSTNLLEDMKALRSRKYSNPILIGNEKLRSTIDTTLRKNVTEKIASFNP